MIKVYKDENWKFVHEHKLQEYLKAGWSESKGTSKKEDVADIPTKTVKAKPTVTKAEAEVITHKGDE